MFAYIVLLIDRISDRINEIGNRVYELEDLDKSEELEVSAELNDLRAEEAELQFALGLLYLKVGVTEEAAYNLLRAATSGIKEAAPIAYNLLVRLGDFDSAFNANKIGHVVDWIEFSRQAERAGDLKNAGYALIAEIRSHKRDERVKLFREPVIGLAYRMIEAREWDALITLVQRFADSVNISEHKDLALEMVKLLESVESDYDRDKRISLSVAADILREIGEYERAISLHMRASEIAYQSGNVWVAIHSELRSAVDIMLSMKREREAAELLIRQGNKIRDEHPDDARKLFIKAAHIYEDLDDMDAARDARSMIPCRAY